MFDCMFSLEPPGRETRGEFAWERSDTLIEAICKQWKNIMKRYLAFGSLLPLFPLTHFIPFVHLNQRWKFLCPFYNLFETLNSFCIFLFLQSAFLLKKKFELLLRSQYQWSARFYFEVLLRGVELLAMFWKGSDTCVWIKLIFMVIGAYKPFKKPKLNAWINCKWIVLNCPINCCNVMVWKEVFSAWVVSGNGNHWLKRDTAYIVCQVFLTWHCCTSANVSSMCLQPWSSLQKKDGVSTAAVAAHTGPPAALGIQR